MREVLPYGRHHITEDDLAAVTNALQADYLTQGPTVKEFENKFAVYIGCDYAVAVSNGTAALHLCALALGVDKASTVITTPITFAASANCIRYCDGNVELVDIDPTTGILDIAKLRAKLDAADSGTYQGLVVVDFAGYSADMEAFRQLADEFGLWIIEDACHAPGGWYEDSKGKKQYCGNGKYADLAIFSFHPVKHIASGEGGMITTNNKELYQQLLKLRTHGITKDKSQHHLPKDEGWYYEMQELGYNYRIPDILCALGLSQLSRAEKGLARRREIAQIYDNAFEKAGIKVLGGYGSDGHAYHLYVILVANRHQLYDQLRERRIYSQVHYIPVYKLPYYKEHLDETDIYPAAEDYYKQCLSLPMYPTLSNEDIDYVISSVIELAEV